MIGWMIPPHLQAIILPEQLATGLIGASISIALRWSHHQYLPFKLILFEQISPC